jgi:dTDP-4-amino-4,6-dideoxygalactose transaminase
VYHQYTVRAPARDELAARLHEAGVEARIYYPTPVHRLRPYERAEGHGDLPETERAVREVLSLPVGPHLHGDQVERIAAAVNEAVSAS